MNRRNFIRAVLLTGVASWLRACLGVRVEITPPPTAATPSAGAPVPSPSPAPPTVAPTAGAKMLGNENREGFFIRYYRAFPAPDRNAWRLRVQGMVENPGEFDYPTVLGWPSVAQVSRMKCVECWSDKAKWEGFTYDTLAAIVKPLPTATHVRFDCADEYWEVVSIEELRAPRVLFVLKMNDELLPDEYGSPLRMILPSKYGYKGAKAVHTLTFTDKDGPGYWSYVGPYSISGDIEPGMDHPLDLGGGVRPISGGEITDY